MALVGWSYIVVVVAAGSTNWSPFGFLKWADFVHFYTLGEIARTRNTSLLYDRAGQHALQRSLVPEATNDDFVPIYAPQTALLFVPFSLLPYFTAGLMWTLFTVAVYAWAVWISWRPARDAIPDIRFVAAAALASPGVWQLAGYGQTTVVIITAFAAAWWALEKEHRIAAGLALSLLAIKPQFGLVLGPLLLFTREGRIIAGILVGLAFQVLAAAATFGASAFTLYLQALRGLPDVAPLLEPNPSKMHSIRALTHLLGGSADIAVWLVATAAIVVSVVRVWNRTGSWRLRFGVLGFASILVNPHLAIYDVTVLTLPVLWIGGWLMVHDDDTSWYWHRVYFIAAALLIPTAAILWVQLSTILLLELFWRVTRLLLAYHGTTQAVSEV